MVGIEDLGGDADQFAGGIAEQGFCAAVGADETALPHEEDPDEGVVEQCFVFPRQGLARRLVARPPGP